MMKPTVLFLFALVFGAFLTSCGDDGGVSEAADAVAEATDASDDADDSAMEEEAADDSAMEEAGDDSAMEEESDDSAMEEEAGDDGASESAGDAVAVSLVEWAIDAPTDIAAGATTFAVTNDGSFAHKFGIALGDSYETLPLLSSGAIDEETLGADFLGDTANFNGGESLDIAFDLEPGNYVLFCNIAVGPNSHAAAGQVLSVTAS